MFGVHHSKKEEFEAGNPAAEGTGYVLSISYKFNIYCSPQVTGYNMKPSNFPGNSI